MVKQKGYVINIVISELKSLDVKPLLTKNFIFKI